MGLNCHISLCTVLYGIFGLLETDTPRLVLSVEDVECQQRVSESIIVLFQYSAVVPIHLRCRKGVEQGKDNARGLCDLLHIQTVLSALRHPGWPSASIYPTDLWAVYVPYRFKKN